MNAITRIPSPLPVPFSKAVKAGGFVFLSGQLAMGPDAKVIDGDITAQTHLILERIAASLEEAGASMAHVVRATIWLANLDDFAAFNAAYAPHFPHGLPARSTVKAELYGGALVEIEVQAFTG